MQPAYISAVWWYAGTVGLCSPLIHARPQGGFLRLFPHSRFPSAVRCALRDAFKGCASGRAFRFSLRCAIWSHFGQRYSMLPTVWVLLTVRSCSTVLERINTEHKLALSSPSTAYCTLLSSLTLQQSPLPLRLPLEIDEDHSISFDPERSAPARHVRISILFNSFGLLQQRSMERRLGLCM